VSRGLGDVYKRQLSLLLANGSINFIGQYMVMMVIP
jgi:hypothetical protein